MDRKQQAYIVTKHIQGWRDWRDGSAAKNAMVLAENLDSVPSTHIVTPVPGDLVPSFDL